MKEIDGTEKAHSGSEYTSIHAQHFTHDGPDIKPLTPRRQRHIKSLKRGTGLWGMTTSVTQQKGFPND